MIRRLIILLLIAVSLLFAFEYSEEIQKHIDFRINDISEEIMIGLNQNIYSIEIEYGLIDTIIVDEIITRENDDSLITSEMKERLAQLRVEIPMTDWFVTLDEVDNTPIFLLFKFQCNPFIDKQLEYNSELRHHKRQLSTTIENFNWCQEKVEDSSFTFIDIIPTEEHEKSTGQTTNLNIDDIYDNSYALIIGIDKYENVRSLDYAVKDAEDIQSMLMDKFNFQRDNIILLKNEEATKASILQEFSNITKKAEANDRVLIFFAGHGKTQDLPDGGEMGYLMPINGDEKDLYISAIDMDELRKISLLSEAKHILYLVDACYGGIASVGARSLNAKSTPDYVQKITQDKGRQMISAGGRGEDVIEKAEWGHSAFTKNLLSGLRDSKADTDSDGIITVQELGTYLKKKVTIDSDNRQTPKTRNLSTDEGEFVFLTKISIQIESELNRNMSANTNNYYNSYSHKMKSKDDEIYIEMMDKIDSIKRQNTLLMIGIGILAVAVFL